MLEIDKIIVMRKREIIIYIVVIDNIRKIKNILILVELPELPT